MDSREAIKLSIEMAEMISMGYLNDLTTQEFMLRPHPDCNHINWQVGHLIVAEHEMINKVAPDSMPPLPAGFAEKYTKEMAKSDDAGAFAHKDELMQTHKQQYTAMLAALSKVSDADLSKPTGVEYAPTVASMYAMQGSHWLMHAGQWVIVRRNLGKPAMF